MKRNVWILNHYASAMAVSKGGRHYWFAKYLKRKGYNPVVFGCNVKGETSELYVDTDELWVEKTDEDISVPFVFVKSTFYTGNGKSRIQNMLGFYHNVKKAGKQYAKKYMQPDVIIASSVHPLTLLAGLQLARHFGVKCICEVRDLWPESIIAFNPKWNKSNLIIKCLYAGEHYIYKKADRLLFTFEGGYHYIKDKGWTYHVPKDKVYYINNGIDLEDFERNRSEYILNDRDLDDAKIFKIIYTGSIRRVNEVGTILDIAKQIKSSNVRFFIWGSGNEVETLKQRINDEHIYNVVFKGNVEKMFVPSIVSRADLNYLHFKTVEMDHRYGISPNKLFDYFAAGKPVISDVSSLFNPVIQEDAGFDISGKTPQIIAEKIDEIVSLSPRILEEKAKNALCASRKYDFSKLTDDLINIIEQA